LVSSAPHTRIEQSAGLWHRNHAPKKLLAG
jgi:hypothetical protein